MATLYMELIHRIRIIIVKLESHSDFTGCMYDIGSLINILSTLNTDYDGYEGEFDQCLRFLTDASDLIDHISATYDNQLIQRGQPETSTGLIGRPKLCMPLEQLEFLLFTCKFSAQNVANILNVSRRTVFRRLTEYGFRISDTYCDMTDDELEQKVSQILQSHPDIGYRSVKAHLFAAGLNMQEKRVRQAMRNVDVEGCLIRRLQLRPVRRRNYKVKAPNSLWHIDGYHKLIR